MSVWYGTTVKLEVNLVCGIEQQQQGDGKMFKFSKVDNEGYVFCRTKKELEADVKHMGWDSLAEFEEDTGVGADELLGKCWNTCRDRIFNVQGNPETDPDDVDGWEE